jgi:hypothetical protein
MRNRDKLLEKQKEYYHKNKILINQKQKLYFRCFYYPKNRLKLNHYDSIDYNDIKKEISSDKKYCNNIIVTI